MDGEEECQCRDGIVCPACTTRQLTQLLQTPPNPLVTQEEAYTIETSMNNWFATLSQNNTSTT